MLMEFHITLQGDFWWFTLLSRLEIIGPEKARI